MIKIFNEYWFEKIIRKIYQIDRGAGKNIYFTAKFYTLSVTWTRYVPRSGSCIHSFASLHMDCYIHWYIVRHFLHGRDDCHMLKKSHSLCNVSNCNDIAVSIKVQNFRSRYAKYIYYKRQEKKSLEWLATENKRSIEFFTFKIKIKMSQKPSNTEKKVKTKGKKEKKWHAKGGREVTHPHVRQMIGGGKRRTPGADVYPCALL